MINQLTLIDLEAPNIIKHVLEGFKIANLDQNHQVLGLWKAPHHDLTVRTSDGILPAYSVTFSPDTMTVQAQNGLPSAKPIEILAILYLEMEYQLRQHAPFVIGSLIEAHLSGRRNLS